MDAKAIRIALASLTKSSSIFTGWESTVKDKLGILPENDQNTISLASVLSSGGSVKDSEKPKQIENIFSTLSLADKPNVTNKIGYIPLGKLVLKRDALFPNAEPASDEQKAQMQTSFQKIAGDEFVENESYLESLLSSLHSIAWCVPSSTHPHVSYYDQQRMTAALAVCLQDLGDVKIGELLKEINSNKTNTDILNQPVALLAGSDEIQSTHLAEALQYRPKIMMG